MEPFVTVSIPSLSLSVSIHNRWSVVVADIDPILPLKEEKEREGKEEEKKGKFSKGNELERNETIAIGAIYAISRYQPAPVFLSLIDRPPREKA